MSITRRTHVVRIALNGADGYIASGGPWVDVEVLDAIGLETPDGDEELFEVMQVSDADETTENNNTAGSGGQQRVYDCTAANATPTIIDNTGDGNAVTAIFPTRSSHMKRLTNADIPGYFLDAEILDALVLKGPQGSELLLYMPFKAATAAVVDPTGNNLEVPVGPKTTRSVHIEQIYDQVTTITNGAPVNTVNKANTILVEKTDAIAFKGPNGEEFLLYAPNNADNDPTDNNDTTQYVIDPWTNQSVPPPNNDPNNYIVFPSAVETSAGPWLGVKTPINQGLLWWIKAAGETITKTTYPPGTYSISVTINIENFNSFPIGMRYFLILKAGDGTEDVATFIGTGESGGPGLGVPFDGTFTLSLGDVTGAPFLYFAIDGSNGQVPGELGLGGSTAWPVSFVATQISPPGTISGQIAPLTNNNSGGGQPPAAFYWVSWSIALDYATSTGSIGPAANAGVGYGPALP